MVEAKITNVLKEHGFEIRPEKIRRGENIEWCGITISLNGRIFPSKPHQLRLDFGSSEKAIDDLQTLDEVRHYYHRWLGIANVGNRWINQELREKTFQLRKIHKPLSERDLQQAKKALKVYARLLNDW